MKHLFYINPLEKLNIKKDSSIFWALTLKKLGHEVYLLFESDLYLSNDVSELKYSCCDFKGEISSDFYIGSFELGVPKKLSLSKNDILHFRLDPPVDASYLKSLWLVDSLREKTGIQVLNDPVGIMKYNEKILAFDDKQSLKTCIGGSSVHFLDFRNNNPSSAYILKPLNSFSGIGVQKISNDEHFESNIKKALASEEGTMMIQPYVSEVVTEGEVRTVFWDAREIGTIKKLPARGSFLSNIAQGAKFHSEDLEPEVFEKCEKISKKLLKDGIRLVAFDILLGKVSEVNITCPGLLVEVSHALNKNIVSNLF